MKKNRRGKKIKKLFFLTILILTYIGTLKLLNGINLNVKNEAFYRFLINSSSSISDKSTISYESFKKVFSFKPNQLLNNNLVYSVSDVTPVVKDDKEKDPKEEVVVKDEKDEEKPKIEDPTVYIYNTHQTESYSGEYLADYSITPDVLISSYMLKEDLEEYGIYSYVEESRVSEVLNKNKWPYYRSYDVTKSFMEKRDKEFPTFKYYIDLHRDSVKKQYTTTKIGDVSYAKIMLLIGLEHDNYQANLKEAQKVNAKLNKYYPGISRGIYKKSGPGVNGIYNQNHSKYTFLFEVGGVDNNISEVNNSITALAKVLAEYIGEVEADQT